MYSEFISFFYSPCVIIFSFFFFFNDTATTEIYTLSLHDALPISVGPVADATVTAWAGGPAYWYVISTGKTDAAGHYRLAYLMPGTYQVSVDAPKNSFASAVDSNVAVNQGSETTHNVSLAAFPGAHR